MSDPTLTIVAYQDSHFADVVDLWNTCFPNDPQRNRPEQMIQQKLRVQRELFLVGLRDERVVSTALGGYDGFRGWIYHVATHPAYRRRGFGAQIVGAVERALLERGCPKLNLQVRAGNDAAVRFYRGLGFSLEGHVSLGKVL